MNSHRESDSNVCNCAIYKEDKTEQAATLVSFQEKSGLRDSIAKPYPKALILKNKISSEFLPVASHLSPACWVWMLPLSSDLGRTLFSSPVHGRISFRNCCIPSYTKKSLKDDIDTILGRDDKGESKLDPLV